MDPAARATDRARLSEIEEEIQRFETHLAALRIERTKIRERLENYSYPVLSLPNEIVTEIFVHYLPPYPDFPPLIGPGSPTYLLGICRLWRSVALHSPMLWRSIELDCEIYRERMGVAQTWLKRSGGVLLSLNLDFGLSRETLEEDSESLLQVVLASRSRWEYIQLVVLPAHIPLISGPVPALVQIDISTRRLEESEADAILFYDSQRLHSVCLWNVEFDAASIPCGHLTSLTLINTRPSPCMAILQTATNLTRCKLYMLPSDTEVESCHILLPPAGDFGAGPHWD
ncbi:hypothetical protein C8F01DRAFT_4477 [Mycena amicta]|nr:hypothetical protein C8F01DRAFT_4477 [Mycena amicta]